MNYMHEQKPKLKSKPCPIFKSPLRYPGGKTALYPYIDELMKQNQLVGGYYYEPFAGGAGIALNLLSSNSACAVMLNDADYHIYCFWRSVLKENKRFIDKIEGAELTIEEWHKQKMIYRNPKKYSVFEVGFSTFFLNRCNRSGILDGAGPIGGYRQSGNWRLDARFNKQSLMKRIFDIGVMKDRITINNSDAILFLKKKLPRGNARKKIFVYVDPPYVAAGNRLYLNYYVDADHETLADYLLSQKNLKWLSTYDDAALIRKLYSTCGRWLFNLGYSLQLNRKGNELLIVPKWLKLPNKNICKSNKWSIIRQLGRIQ